MSLIQSGVVLYLFISIGSCVSLTSTIPAEVTTGRYLVKNNTMYDIIISAMFRRFNKGILDGIQEKTRVKKTTELVAEVAKLPPMKLMTLTALVFRNMFSKGLVGKDPPLSPEYAVEPFVKMIQNGIEAMKDSLGHHNFE